MSNWCLPIHGLDRASRLFGNEVDAALLLGMLHYSREPVISRVLEGSEDSHDVATLEHRKVSYGVPQMAPFLRATLVGHVHTVAHENFHGRPCSSRKNRRNGTRWDSIQFCFPRRPIPSSLQLKLTRGTGRIYSPTNPLWKREAPVFWELFQGYSAFQKASSGSLPAPHCLTPPQGLRWMLWSSSRP